MSQENAVEVDLEAGSGVKETAPDELTLVSVTVSKPTKDVLVGLGVVDRPGHYGKKTIPVINTIKDGGLCAGTDLKTGMTLYSINGVKCKGRDDATSMLKVCEGPVTIVAGPPGLIWASVVKPDKEAKVGLHMERYKSSDRVVVGSVKGLFADTELKEGMTILKINDVAVAGKSMAEVLDMVATAEKQVSVLAQAPLDLSTAAIIGHPPPEGLAGGEWGSTSYVGPITAALAIAAIPTVVGWAIILLFCPCDRIDVYKVGGNLYTPNGEFYKNATARNFEIRKKEHLTEKAPGVWGTTTYVGPLTWATAIVAAITVVGWIVVLLFFPMDEREVYYADGKLYYPTGYFYKSATEKNFKLSRSSHLQA